MHKKKTGILTLSSAQNYGAVLQCYSLCKYLNENFSKTEIIDYTPDFIVGRYPLFRLNYSSLIHFMKSIISSMINLPFKIIKKIRFYKFRKSICNYSKKKYLRVFDDDCYEQYIVGSDQVFNLELTGNEKEFFLPNIKDSNKKATYAASLGVDKLDSEKKAILKKELKSFSNISIREETGKNLIKELLIDKNIVQNLDSVFLTSKEDWEKIARKRLYKDKYILIYTFKSFDLAYQLAKKINNSMDIVYINDGIRLSSNGIKNARAVGPCEFLSLIKNAEYIVTDSFHGTAFSIIFNREFTSIPYKGTESRFIDLLSSLSLENRGIYSLNDLNMDKIDYSKVNNRLKELVQKSYDYFKNVYS